MKKDLVSILIISVCFLFITGCATVMTPVVGGLYTNVKAPVAATALSGSSKVGKATATSILGIIATGDASIKAACDNAGITKIHSVDYEGTSVLGIYATFTTIVHGE